MSITRHDSSGILSQAVEHGDTVYLAGVVAKGLDKDIKEQTKEVLGEIDRLLGKCGSHKSKVLQAQCQEPPGTGLRGGEARRSARAGGDHGDRRQIGGVYSRRFSTASSPHQLIAQLAWLRTTGLA